MAPRTGIAAVRIRNHPIRTTFSVVFLLLATSLRSHCADIVFVRTLRGSSLDEQRIQLASQFYGLNLKTLPVTENDRSPEVLRALAQKTTVAAIITASALPALREKEVFSALRRAGPRSAPLLIVGLTPETDPGVLKKWSGGAVIACRSSRETPLRGFFKVTNLRDVARQLAGQEIPSASESLFYLDLDKTHKSHTILEAWEGDRGLPIFVQTAGHAQEVFLQTETSRADRSTAPKPTNLVTLFAEIAPAMMFTRYSAGERAWHSVGHYANLTIDDAWLREPYGHVTYQGLLQEMQKHNFHTTIAFIPWNFDRSQPEVVSVIRSHPDRFSICIHGDNHTRAEFGSNRPLNAQVADIKQAIARMSKFRSSTELPYDSVMVFPHERVATLPVLSKLREYGFWAAANAMNAPQDSDPPADALFLLRSVTLAFASFPLLRRYSVEAPVSQPAIAINAFLDNSLLFYCHHNFFASGIDAFGPVARVVNDLQPDTRWQSLGSIVEHLYLIKLRDDANYDVRAFSDHLSLTNESGRQAVFNIEKPESDSPPIRSLTVDGRPYPYQLSDNRLRLELPIRARESRHISIEYENDLEISSVDTAKQSSRANLLRSISDFRDIELSKYLLGRALVRLYSGAGPVQLLTLFALVTALSFGAGWYLRTRIRSRSTRED